MLDKIRFAHLGSVALLILATASPAGAAVQIIGNHYQDNVKSACAAAPSTVCLINFADIDSNDFIVIRQVSCRIITNPQAKFSTLQLGANPVEGNLIFTSYLTPQLVSALPSRAIYNLNHQVELTIIEFHNPRITIGVAAGGDITHADCTVSGEIGGLVPE